MTTSAHSTAHSAERRLRLRLLETTDVHANLLPFDYFANAPVSHYGLTRTASLIDQARRHPNTLLFDNGDYLQGTPISDLTAFDEADKGAPHPCITAMNALRYDAVGLGNHEFNFGLPWLERALSQAQFPVTCANLERCVPKEANADVFSPYVLLDRNFQDETGAPVTLRIGVMGLAPPQTTMWDRYFLKDQIVSTDILDTARRLVPEMRAQGADLIVVLSHSGIEPGPPFVCMENAALQLGAIEGIDAILAGHTHQVFPANDFVDEPEISEEDGTLQGTAAVMAGMRGAYLGVIDLELTQEGTGPWQVRETRSEAVPVTQDTPEHAPLRECLAETHDRTVVLSGEPLGYTETPLHSYLALLAPCAALQLVAEAKMEAVRARLAGTELGALPLLAGAAPFKTGGPAGPGFFTDIPRGPLCLRHAADLYSFPNHLCVLHLTGAELKDWLERTTVPFRQISPSGAPQWLRDPAVPGHQFEVIHGLRYEIDLSQPARYTLEGELAHPEAQRIRNLTYQGAEVADDQTFLLASNNYRAYGAGPYKAVRPDQIKDSSARQLRDVVAGHIGAHASSDALQKAARRTWSFTPLGGIEVLYQTGPGIRAYASEIDAIGATDLGDTPDGFITLSLTL